MLQDFLITLDMKFHQNRSVRSRDIDVLVKTRRRFLKPDVNSQTNKNYRFLESDSHADYKNIFCFINRSKIEKFCKNMQILQILIHHFECLMICDFLQTL